MRPSEMLINVIAALKAKRIDLSLSQQSVASKVGTTRQALSYWEDGERFPLSDNLFKWASVLDAEIKVLAQ